jgi:hypothetical protein
MNRNEVNNSNLGGDFCEFTRTKLSECFNPTCQQIASIPPANKSLQNSRYPTRWTEEEWGVAR